MYNLISVERVQINSRLHSGQILEDHILPLWAQRVVIKTLYVSELAVLAAQIEGPLVLWLENSVLIDKSQDREALSFFVDTGAAGAGALERHLWYQAHQRINFGQL